MKETRRSFIINSGKGLLGISALSAFPLLNSHKAMAQPDLFFKISLAEWSLNKTLFSGKLTNMEFPAKAKNDFGIQAVEYVNQFFMDKAEDEAYLKELKSRTSDLGITNVLIMIDNEGYLADESESKRITAVENHYKWVEAARFLGCHSIRVNAYATSSDPDAGKKAAIDGLSRLTTFAEPYGIGIIVENHGGFSSNGVWLADVIQKVNKPLCGTLPDFGNFCIKRGPNGCEEEYDKYKGVKELMPFAKGVSAKSGRFDTQGNETNIDYMGMLQIVKDAGYTGYVGIESGSDTDEDHAIRLTKTLLEKVGRKLS
ncbi:MAG: sugar phosphate isomerase/epimerase [Cyclobacteriaceae bacterium]|nr:sugar phosphate isomerase/epimerase [Cyclobacteriaceae bacterium]